MRFGIITIVSTYISFNYKKLKMMSDALGYDSFNSDCKLINENVYSYFDFYLSKEIKDQSSYTLCEEEHSLLSNIARLLNDYMISIEKNETNKGTMKYLAKDNTPWTNILKSMETVSGKEIYNHMIHEQYFNIYK